MWVLTRIDKPREVLLLALLAASRDRDMVKAEVEVVGVLKPSLHYKEHIQLYERPLKPPSEVKLTCAHARWNPFGLKRTICFHALRRKLMCVTGRDLG